MTDDQELREAAEKHLRALAGENARLRDDQWTAIRALVAERRRALVVQRTGWGKSAVYFVATALLRARGAGPTVIVSPLLALMRNQVEAAERAGIHARTINSANLERVAAGLRRGQRTARSTCCWSAPSGSTTPGSATRCCRSLAASGGPARDRRGALHLRLGARLPPRLPAHPHAARRAPAGHPGARHDRDGERPGHRATSPSSSARPDPDDVLVLRGALDRESLHLAVVELPGGRRAARLARRPGSPAARCRARGSSTR